MSYKRRIVELINKGVPEVKDIYQGTLTIIERMLLWDFIEKVNWIDKSEESPDVMEKCYQSFIQEVNKFITEEPDGLKRVNMECLKSKMLAEPLQSRHNDFIQEMAVMVKKENCLIDRYYFDEKPIQDTLETLFISKTDCEDCVMETLKSLAEDLKLQLRASHDRETQVLATTKVHGAQGQLIYSQMKEHCAKVGQVCCGLFNNFFQKMEEAMVYLKLSKKVFQKKMAFDSVNLPMYENAMSLQALDDNFQILTSALWSVNEEMKKYEDDMVQYSKRGQSDLHIRLPEYQQKWKTFLHEYLKMSVLTIKNPANQYLKPSTIPAKKKESEKRKKKSSEAEKDKREKSKLNSTLKILGSESFGPNFRIKPDTSTVHLVDENSLPERITDGTDLGLQSGHVKLCGELKPESPPELNEDTELTFYREEIAEMMRLKSETVRKEEERASIVCANFSRLCYKIDVEVYGECHTLHTVSQPIGLKTGSAQLLPFHGSLTWYFWNVDNVYENFRIPQKLPVTKVLDMLDEQISNIKDQTNAESYKTKSRSLSTNERKCLQNMLLGEESTSEMVCLTDFICVPKTANKRKLSKDSTQNEIPLFDFHTWFFALLKSFNGFMKGLWLDCIIYEICSVEETSKILRREETPMGTIMLRPSLTRIRNQKCMEAHLDLVLDFKTNRGSSDIANVSWDAAIIKHLPEALQTDATGLKAIQGVNNRRWPVSILDNYFSNDATLVYRSTVFKLTMSLQVVDSDENSQESSRGGKKKTRLTEFEKGESPPYCTESSSCSLDHQSVLHSAIQHGRREMISPGSSDAVASPSMLTPTLAELNAASPSVESHVSTDLTSNPLLNEIRASELNNDTDVIYATELMPLIPTVFRTGDQMQYYLQNI